MTKVNIHMCEVIDPVKHQLSGPHFGFVVSWEYLSEKYYTCPEREVRFIPNKKTWEFLPLCRVNNARSGNYIDHSEYMVA